MAVKIETIQEQIKDKIQGKSDSVVMELEAAKSASPVYVNSIHLNNSMIK